MGAVFGAATSIIRLWAIRKAMVSPSEQVLRVAQPVVRQESPSESGPKP
jgi:hypothetical protein